MLAKFSRDGREVFQMRPCHDRPSTRRRLQNIVSAAPRQRASHEDHIGDRKQAGQLPDGIEQHHAGQRYIGWHASCDRRK